MSVRRWIGFAGLVVAVAAGTAATVRGVSEARFEAQVSVLLERPQPKGVPVLGLDGPERLLDSPEVSELVRSRLGETPPVRVTAAADDTVVVRSRGATPWQAAAATETYAASYVDVRRRQIEAEAGAAAEGIRRKIVQLESQLGTAEEPQRASLVGLLGLFNQQLDRLQLDLHGPRVLDSTPAQPVDDGTRGARVVAALGATLCVGAAVSARRASRRCGATAANI